jgi:uncharacterized protein
MKNVERHLAKQLLLAKNNFPALVLTGPRRAGKTWLLKHLFGTLGKKPNYFLFEDPDIVARFRHDPRGFLDEVQPPAIFDEIQHVPEVFNHLRTRIDAAPRKKGLWFLTGSQESSLMREVSESMAGRAAILHLLPMSYRENQKVSMVLGGYPEVLARPKAARLWFSSYIQSYLERDVRSISAVQNLAQFRRFMALLASRHGQVLNKADLAAAMGMSVPGVAAWLDILELTGIVLIVQPYFENLGKRLLKSPKIYIADSGLTCHLLGIESEAELNKSPFKGSVFEGFVASEIVKSQVNNGRRKALYYFRDQQGLEVDFVYPSAHGTLQLVEVKATQTPLPAMCKPMQNLLAALDKSAIPSPPAAQAFLVHSPTRSKHPMAPSSQAIAPGVKAMPWPQFFQTALHA